MLVWTNIMAHCCCGQLWVWHMFCGQDLWWAIPLHIYHWSGWDTNWIPTDYMDLRQTHCKQVPDFSGAQGHVVRFGPITDRCALAFVFQVRSLYVPSSTLALKPSVSPPFYPWVTATLWSFMFCQSDILSIEMDENSEWYFFWPRVYWWEKGSQNGKRQLGGRAEIYNLKFAKSVRHF